MKENILEGSVKKTSWIHPYKRYLLDQAIGNRTLNQFAADAGVDAGNLSRIARGQKASLDVIKKIAVAAEDSVTYDQLLKLFGPIPNGSIKEDEFETFRNLLPIVLADKGWDLNFFDELSDFTRIHNSTVASWLDKSPMPTYEDIYCLSDLLGVSHEYLLGHPIKEGLSHIRKMGQSNSEIEELKNLIDYKNVHSVIKRKNSQSDEFSLNRSNTFILKVIDDSLNNVGINYGDNLIFEKPYLPSLNYPHVLCLSEEDENLIVRYLSKINDVLVFHATNPEYPDIQRDSVFKIIGTVSERIEPAPSYSEYKKLSGDAESLEEEWQSVVSTAKEMGIGPSNLQKLLLTVSAMTKELL